MSGLEVWVRSKSINFFDSKMLFYSVLDQYLDNTLVFDVQHLPLCNPSSPLVCKRSTPYSIRLHILYLLEEVISKHEQIGFLAFVLLPCLAAVQVPDF